MCWPARCWKTAARICCSTFGSRTGVSSNLDDWHLARRRTCAMKALRKCACVAVQLVVTTLLLFQQCPVQAIALGVERGSDYVEIPASEEDADAADGSVDAPSSGDNPNESAPSTAEKDEAVSGADNAAGTTTPSRISRAMTTPPILAMMLRLQLLTRKSSGIAWDPSNGPRMPIKM